MIEWRNLNETWFWNVRRMHVVTLKLRFYFAYVMMGPLFEASGISIDSNTIECVFHQSSWEMNCAVKCIFDASSGFAASSHLLHALSIFLFSFFVLFFSINLLNVLFYTWFFYSFSMRLSSQKSTHIFAHKMVKQV